VYCFSIIDLRRISHSKDTGRIVKDKLQKEKTGNITNEDLENMQHQPTA